MASSVEEMAGVSEGTELNGEVVVADHDEQGNIIGWHKVIKE